jgi:hypothetical protein
MMSMTTRSRRITALGATLFAIAALTGCSVFASEEFPTLERERTAADVLPSEVVSQLDADVETAIDPESVRLAGDYEGAQFFVARTNGNRGYCLVIYPTTEKWSSGCSASPQIEVYAQDGYSARLALYGTIAEGEDGWVALTDDVLVHKANANLHTGPQ